ncbi:DUF3787 domain-containing protein [Clostridium sp. JN-9]|uniref:CDIF630_02480 family spore surface protein n=1 Tax=Clostridium sp. JN-9 TaxID=2507159 RepID=UPI000FFE1550|nr:DUF3787 domain-containing protein [Clostridium sp. JN-9]QAT39213.1 DUF3787 domain-containing protein [Clostridium sp. JN-9]
MVKPKDKKNSNNQPIENHNTAAWADVKEAKEISNVAIPSENQVINAKKWVDTNEK